MYEDQLKLKGESERIKGELKNWAWEIKRKRKWKWKRKYKDDCEKGKEEEKTWEKRKKCVERKEKKAVSFYPRESEIMTTLYSNQPMIALLYKEACFNTNNLDVSLSSVFASLLNMLNYIS